MARKLRRLGTASAVADQLGVHRSTVSRQLKKMGKSSSTRVGKRAQALGPSDAAAIRGRLRPSTGR